MIFSLLTVTYNFRKFNLRLLNPNHNLLLLILISVTCNIIVVATAVLPSLKRLEVTYPTHHSRRPLWSTRLHNAWCLLVPAIAKLVLKNQFVPAIAVPVINHEQYNKQENKFFVVKTVKFVGDYMLNRDEWF